MDGIQNVRCVSFSEAGTVRSNNEDNMYSSLYQTVNRSSENTYYAAFSSECIENPMMFAIFDGMGGTSHGEVASLEAAKQAEIMYDSLKERSPMSDEELSKLLHETKQEIEKNIFEIEKRQYDNSGTTCSGFVLEDGEVKPFWIGDSRIYLFRNNELFQLTKDHTVAQDNIDYGLISLEEAMKTSGWHRLTKYIGDCHNDFSIGSSFEVEPGDKYLLCTDGISDKFSPEQIADFMLEEPEELAEEVRKEVNISSDDNASAIVVYFVPKDKSVRNNKDELTRRICTAYVDKLRSILN